MSENVISQTDFDDHIAKWKNMERTTHDASNAALTYYDEYIFPFVKKIFINNPRNCPPRKYDALILTVGLSPEPLILSIIATKPERVGLLHTPQTRKFLARIQDETGLPLDQLYPREIDGSDIVKMYESIMELYTSWDRPAKVAVDITGGKKSMVSGAAMAGAVLGADIYYVDTDNFSRELGKPEPGSEYLSLLDDPYTVFGDLEVNKARDLCDRHDYAGAQRIFNQLEGQVSDPNLIKVYEAYEFLCATYEAWDNLDIDKAKKSLKSLLTILKRFSSVKQLEPLFNFMPILKQHKIALDSLGNIFNKEELALHIPDGFHFAFMLYHNVLRREAQGKLNTACLILYRLLEWIGQHRLAKYQIITRQPDYSNSGEEEAELLDRYQGKRKDIYGDTSVSTLPNPIALVDGFLILDALDDEIVENLTWPALKGQIEIRNQSVYAHGMSKINERSFAAFKKTVEELFTKAQEIANPAINAETFTKQHKFITPLP